MRRAAWVVLVGATMVGATLVGVGAAPAQAVVPPGSAPVGATAAADLERHITAALPQRLHDPRLGSDVAIQVRTADGTKVFSSRASDRQLPASNMKLVTAFGALTTLGPDAALSTRVGTLTSGGGLVLVGGGDPLLSSSGVDRLARAAAEVVAHKGRVKVYVNDRYFRDGSLAPGWRKRYVPGEVTYVRSLGRHGAVVTDTAKDAGAHLVATLRARGVHAVYAGRSGAAYTTVATVSHTVAEALAVMLRDSDNQIAETLFRQTALAAGRPATWSGGSAAARAALDAHGIPTAGLRLRDGSGLSRRDRLTPAALTELLSLVQSGTVPGADRLLSWLPVAGRTGTLAAANGRYTTAPSRCAVGLVHAKTGTLTGAVALSGTAMGYDGNVRVFSILVNHPPTRHYSVLTVRRAIDGLAATVTGCW